MATPKAVEAQDAQADELLELFDGAETDNPGAPEEAAPAEAESNSPAEEVPASDAPAQGPAVSDEVSELRKQLEYEKHRNDSLQGRLDSQLRPLNDTVRELRAQVVALEAQQSQRENELREAVPAHLRHLRPEEAEAVGKEAVDVQSRIARGVAEDIVRTREQEIAERQKATDQRLADLEEQRQVQSAEGFWNKVEGIVPGARAVNESDPQWYTFLDSVDQYSGRLRRDIGQAAMSLGDVKRVADLVQEFKVWSGKTQPRAPVSPAVPRPETVRATPAVPSASSTAPTIRASQIKKFYDDWTRGKFGADDAKAAQIEAAILKAMDEGRVIEG